MTNISEKRSLQSRSQNDTYTIKSVYANMYVVFVSSQKPKNQQINNITCKLFYPLYMYTENRIACM